MKEKKLRPKRRFKEFENDEAWEQRKLGEVVKLGSSKRVHREDYVEIGIPFFRGLEISKLGTSTKLEDVLYISEKYYKKLRDSYGVPKIGDILITAVGTLGNTYLIHDNMPFYFKDGNLIWLSNIQINSEYLNTYLDNGIGKKRVLESAAGSNQKALTMVNLENVEVIFPGIEEQKKISTFFSNLDNLITLHQHKLKKLKETKSAYLSEMFPKEGEKYPKRRFDGFTNPWEERKLFEVAEFNPKSELPDKFEYVDLESVVGTEMISHRTETKHSAPSRAQRLAKNGDIFYQTVRPYQKNNYLFTKSDNNYVFSTGYAQMRPNIDTTFLMSLLQTEAFVKVVLDNCTGTSYPAINSTDLSNLEISLPISRDEQRKIGGMFSNLDNLITLNQRKLEKLENLKKAYLNEMFV